MRASVFIATSLDGYIARPDGALDWLPGADGSALPEDHGYDAFFASVDVVVLGRGSFEAVRAFSPWPYGDKPVRVLAHGALELPAALRATVAVRRGTPAEIVEGLAREGFGHAYVDGGRTIQDFLRAGLVQKLTLTRVPVLLGAGIPLFGALPHDVPLLHVRTRAFANGLVQSEYEVAPAMARGGHAGRGGTP